MYQTLIVANGHQAHQAELRRQAEQWRLQQQARPVRQRDRRRARQVAAVAFVLATAAGLVAALPAAPAEAASPSTVSRSGNSVLFTAGADTVNAVQVFLDENNEMTVTDEAGIVDIPGDGCSVFFGDTAKCGNGVTRVELRLGDLDDQVKPQAAVVTDVRGEAGNDTAFGGMVAGTSDMTYTGGEGLDTVTYVNSDRFVTVDVSSSFALGGRPGDRDNVNRDVERLIGSRFPDDLTGEDAIANVLDGLGGPDTLRGLSGNDNFVQGRFAAGADDIIGGAGIDTVSYSQRAGAVRVDQDGVADDGAVDAGGASEGDNVRGDVENVLGGAGDDVLLGNGSVNLLSGGAAGADRLVGRGGGDDLDAGVDNDAQDVDSVNGGGGNDSIDAVDGVRDAVRCGPGAGDTASIDAGLDTIRACESVGTP